MTDVTVSGEVKLGDPELALLNIATRKDQPILASILSKAVKSITIEEKRPLQMKWRGEPKVVVPVTTTLEQPQFIAFILARFCFLG
jgi:hypothetical protein